MEAKKLYVIQMELERDFGSGKKELVRNPEAYAASTMQGALAAYFRTIGDIQDHRSFTLHIEYRGGVDVTDQQTLDTVVETK